MTSRAVVSLATLLVSACTVGNVTPAVEAGIEKSREIPVPYEISWSRAVDWFADHAVEVDKIDEQSGLITAKYTLLPEAAVVDCGDIEFAYVRGEPEIQRTGLINVRIREVDPSTSQATVNLFGGFRADAVGSIDNQRLTLEGVCYSTGEIEQEVLNFIAGAPSGPQPDVSVSIVEDTSAPIVESARVPIVETARVPAVESARLPIVETRCEGLVQPASTSQSVRSAWRVQVASIRDESGADGEWARLTRRHPDILCGLSLDVRRADLDRGVFYRLHAGPLPDRRAAAAVCGRLESRSQRCLIVSP